MGVLQIGRLDAASYRDAVADDMTSLRSAVNGNGSEIESLNATVAKLEHRVAALGYAVDERGNDEDLQQRVSSTVITSFRLFFLELSL